MHKALIMVSRASICDVLTVSGAIETTKPEATAAATWMTALSFRSLVEVTRIP